MEFLQGSELQSAIYHATQIAGFVAASILLRWCWAENNKYGGEQAQ